MSLYTTLLEDIKKYLRQKDIPAANTLRSIKNILIVPGQKGQIISTEEVISALRKGIKLREDAIIQFKKGNRQDLIDAEQMEIDILSEYLPPPISQEDLQNIVSDALHKTGATSKKQMGEVMKVVVETVAGRLDKRTISLEVQRQIESIYNDQ